MTDYKRLTERDEFGNADIIGIDSELLYENLMGEEDNKLTNVLNRFAEFEDMIENGTLIELPLDIYVLEDYAHKLFDSWNDITGAISKNCSWYYEVLSVIDDIVGMVWGIISRQYEAKFRELKGERQ